jgi:hypothetical protein
MLISEVMSLRRTLKQIIEMFDVGGDVKYIIDVVARTDVERTEYIDEPDEPDESIAEMLEEEGRVFDSQRIRS